MEKDELVSKLGDALKGAGPLGDNLSCAALSLGQAGSPGWEQSVNEARDMIRAIALLYYEAKRAGPPPIERQGD